ncbi:uncharacterized protein LOC101851099 [Aplysia californica]|uniref:Uncharacterized protein LOC101851099 n=1 Tax=Aplysia californica TaxID=6500 RepID=A0ABM0JDN8_APLCA|nr:uncharacterized protein LOC101851099 [Aplysia californica]
MDGSRESAETEQENDNTISEELSRFSSASESQSSSCTSITNPFYEGPSEADTTQTSSTSVKTARRTSSSGRRRESGCQMQPCSASCMGHRRQGSHSHCQTHPMYPPQGARMSAPNHEENVEQRVIIVWDLGYLVTCSGFLQSLQLIMTIATLVCLVSSGAKEGGLLNLPLSWHFRIMIFVLVLTLLVIATLFFGNITSLITIFGFEWTFFDMIVYSLFAFFYLVGSSLVASAFDFYEKMKTDVSKDTISQLVTSVILGYLCMLLHGLSAFLSYRKWKIQYRLYQRRKLIEEDEIDL